MDLPLIFAHRGAWQDKREQNSLVSVKRAVEMKMDGLEIDVQKTRDHKLVVFHNKTLEGRAIRHLTYNEINAIFPIPLLRDVLQASGDLRINIDFKAAHLAKPVAKLLNEYDTTRFVITGNPLCAMPIKVFLPHIHVGQSIDQAGVAIVPFADFLCIKHTLLDYAWPTLPIYTWTVDDARDLRRVMQNPRVHALMTNRPLLAMQTRERLIRSRRFRLWRKKD